jgi:hypothetical protein
MKKNWENVRDGLEGRDRSKEGERDRRREGPGQAGREKERRKE